MRVVPPSTNIMMYVNTKIERKQNIIAVALLRFSPTPALHSDPHWQEANISIKNLKKTAWVLRVPSPLPGITTNVLICEAHMNKSNSTDNRP